MLIELGLAGFSNSEKLREVDKDNWEILLEGKLRAQNVERTSTGSGEKLKKQRGYLGGSLKEARRPDRPPTSESILKDGELLVPSTDCGQASIFAIPMPNWGIWARMECASHADLMKQKNI
ncbi:unnamed protein product [Blepharisma stoltei]|uniref:Uncharacterized protein n=1 Tax=Blepharisma stoltei TaxID=1481888 RepID=A0AAU9KFD2_9CILI|nr:unnamed protein product [Blepharisma stoltei]